MKNDFHCWGVPLELLVNKYPFKHHLLTRDRLSKVPTFSRALVSLSKKEILEKRDKLKKEKLSTFPCLSVFHLCLSHLSSLFSLWQSHQQRVEHTTGSLQFLIHLT